MWQLNQSFPVSSAAFAPASSTPFSLTAVANATDTNPLTTYTFAAMNFGTAHASRVLAIGILARNSAGTQAVSSVNFAGTAGTSAITHNNAGADRSEIWYANVPSGTSGTVTITFAGANQRCGVQLYSIISPSSNAPTVTATSSANTTVTSGSISIPAGGAAFMCAMSLTGGPGTPTGSPAGFVNLDLNSNPTGTQQMWAIHSNAGVVTGTQTLTATLTGSSTNTSCFAVWGP